MIFVKKTVYKYCLVVCKWNQNGNVMLITICQVSNNIWSKVTLKNHTFPAENEPTKSNKKCPYTVLEKCFWMKNFAWSKTSLNKAVWERQGWANILVRRGQFMLWQSSFQKFPIKWSFVANTQTKISSFYYNKSGNLCLRVCQEAPFDWIFFENTTCT